MNLKKILLTLLLCADFATAATSCAQAQSPNTGNPDKPSDTTTSVPDIDISGASGIIPDIPTEPSHPDEPKIELCEAQKLCINGEFCAYIPCGSEISELEELLCCDKREELTSSGIAVKNIDLNNEITLAPCMCKTEEITSLGEAADAILQSRELSFTTVVTETENETLDFETVYKNSSSHYEGTEVTQTEGKNGSKQLTYECTYSDGDPVSKTLISEKVISEAQDKVVLVGTKKSTASKGIYIWPTKKVYITSYYGNRVLSGKKDFHYGIDLRAANGTAIYASDGGEVIYAGTLGTYGKIIKIKHDNGDMTYYAHLSSFSVKVGQRVYQGQQIAKSGSTGNVTGPHLHFEIRKNGTHKNPLNYLPKL